MSLRFDRRPFRPAPAPELYRATPVHDAALAALRSAVNAGDGLSLLDGPAGSGKTLLALKLLADTAGAAPVFLPSSRFERPAELHQALLFDLGKDVDSKSDSELRLALQETLLTNAASGMATLLALDDAHDLGPAVLDDLRHLDNLAVRGLPAISILLVGCESLRDRLPSSVASRLSQCVRLDALDLAGSRQFLLDQIAAAGGDEDCFDAEAIELLVAECRGLPRLLNRTAARALALATEAGSECVDTEAVLEALARLALPAQPETSTARLSPEAPSARDAGAMRTPKAKPRPRKAA